MLHLHQRMLQDCNPQNRPRVGSTPLSAAVLLLLAHVATTLPRLVVNSLLLFFALALVGVAPVKLTHYGQETDN